MRYHFTNAITYIAVVLVFGLLQTSEGHGQQNDDKSVVEGGIFLVYKSCPGQGQVYDDRYGSPHECVEKTGIAFLVRDRKTLIIHEDLVSNSKYNGNIFHYIEITSRPNSQARVKKVLHCDGDTKLCIISLVGSLPGRPLPVSILAAKPKNKEKDSQADQDAILASGFLFSSNRPPQFKEILLKNIRFRPARGLYDYHLEPSVLHIGGPLLNRCNQIVGVSYKENQDSNASAGQKKYLAISAKVLKEIFDDASENLKTTPGKCENKNGVKSKPISPGGDTKTSRNGKNTKGKQKSRAKIKKTPATTLSPEGSKSSDEGGNPANSTPISGDGNKEKPDGIASIILLAVALSALAVAAFAAFGAFANKPSGGRFLIPTTRKIREIVPPSILSGGLAEQIGGRDEQQDSSLYLDGPGQQSSLAVIADGMGGHSGGAVASRIIIDTATTAWQAADGQPDDVLGFLDESFLRAHHAINAAGEGRNMDPHSTFVALCISYGTAYYAHIGDSRLYLIRDGVTQRLTRDHSVLQMAVDMGDVAEEDMGDHPDQGSLLKSMGGDKEPEISHASMQASVGDVYLLCSDGLWEQVTPKEMALATAQPDLQNACEKLAFTASKRGGSAGDNVSVVMVRCQ